MLDKQMGVKKHSIIADIVVGVGVGVGVATKSPQTLIN